MRVGVGGKGNWYLSRGGYDKVTIYENKPNVKRLYCDV